MTEIGGVRGPGGPKSSEIWPSIGDMLMSRVVKTANGCWEYDGAQTGFGYGSITWDGKKLMAHRAAYEFYCGPIPEGMSVLHRCDNPRCCNPDHLFIGTQKDNIDDMVAKGRGNHKGERNSCAKLTSSAVHEIRRLLALGNMYEWEIAERFGVARSTVNNIKRGTKWRYLPKSTLSWRRWHGELPKKPVEQPPVIVVRRR
jgi:hypothetical protein